MKMHSKTWDIVGASQYTLSQSTQCMFQEGIWLSFSPRLYRREAGWDMIPLEAK